MAKSNDTTQEFNEREYAQRLVNQGYSPEQARDIARKTAEARNHPSTAMTPVYLDKVKTISNYAAEVLALDQEEAERAGAIGFMARAMVQATMPHSKPKETYFKRKNGNYTLFMQANQEVGLPYGVIPRLLIAWMTQEAVRTKTRELLLGNSLSAFMRELSFIPSGGSRGTIPALKRQMQRLFTTTISCTYSDEERKAGIQMFLVDKYNLWWHPKNPDQQSLWQSTITLSDNFFQEVTTSPIPVRMRTLEALKGSSMALDIYCWLTYRNFYAQRSIRIPWEALQVQFGAGYPDTTQGKRDFKKNFLIALKKVGVAYPEAQKLQVETDVLVYVPGYPDVSPVVPSETF
jgi:hypothetical protein